MNAPGAAGEGDAPAPARLFAYGTLQIAAVVRAVLGRRPEAREAELRGYARSRVAGALHPGLHEAAGAPRGLPASPRPPEAPGARPGGLARVHASDHCSAAWGAPGRPGA